MKKIMAFLLVCLSLLQASVAFADIPSPFKLQQRHRRSRAEQLEQKGISIKNIEIAAQENKEITLGIELDCLEGGQLECKVKTIDNGRIVGEYKEVVNDSTKRKNNNYWFEVPIDTGAMVSGKNELEINCSYKINYEIIRRLGGGYAWFKAGRPMKKTAKSVSKEATKRIALMKTSTRYFVYEI
jgi:hypothetical protein